MSDQPVHGNAPGTNSGGQEQLPGANAGEEKVTLTKAELQARIDSVIKERLEREKRKADEAAQKAREAAEQEAMQKNQEWQKLAETHAERIKQLEAGAQLSEAEKQKVERYEKALRAQLDTQRASLPKPVLTLLDRLDPAEQLEWIAANRGDLEAQKPAVLGTPPSPKPGDPKAQTSEEQEKARREASRLYQQLF